MSSTPKKLVLGTRGSELALFQTRAVRGALLSLRSDLEIEIVEIVTSGDKKQGLGEKVLRDKKEWVIELENALVDGSIDAAVHSSKDVPIDIEPQTSLTPVLGRADHRDVCILSESKRAKYGTLESMIATQEEIVLGTASLRRATQLHKLSPQIRCVPIRGNVKTRIAKLGSTVDGKIVDGIVLAAAGLRRLDVNLEKALFLESEFLVPSVNQGSLAVQYRANDSSIEKLLSELKNSDEERIWRAERKVVEILQADCRSALGVYAMLSSPDNICIETRIVEPSDGRCIEHRSEGAIGRWEDVASSHARTLLALGASELL